MSDLERAQEWLGCRRGEFVGALTGNVEAICEMHGLADDWPCRKATRLAALLAETRADALEEFAADCEFFAEEAYGADVFPRPTKLQYAHINSLLQREVGHQLDRISADVMTRAINSRARAAREKAKEIRDGD